MFVVMLIRDTVKVLPHLFGDPLNSVIVDNLNVKYANRIIEPHGLGIAVQEVVKHDDDQRTINVNDGAVLLRVDFKLIVWRPMVGLLAEAKIRSQDRTGIQLTTRFFENIFVPCDALAPGTFFNETEKVYMYPARPMQDPNVYEKQDSVIFKITKVIYERVPAKNEETSEPASLSLRDMVYKSNMVIEGSMALDGTGPLAWWAEDTETETVK